MFLYLYCSISIIYFLHNSICYCNRCTIHGLTEFILNNIFTQKTCQVKNQRDKIWATEEEVYPYLKKKSHTHMKYKCSQMISRPNVSWKLFVGHKSCRIFINQKAKENIYYIIILWNVEWYITMIRHWIHIIP